MVPKDTVALLSTLPHPTTLAILLSFELAVYTPWEVGMAPPGKTLLGKSLSCRSPRGQIAGFLSVGDICAFFQPKGRCWGLLAQSVSCILRLPNTLVSCRAHLFLNKHHQNSPQEVLERGRAWPVPAWNFLSSLGLRSQSLTSPIALLPPAPSAATRQVESTTLRDAFESSVAFNVRANSLSFLAASKECQPPQQAQKLEASTFSKAWH